MDCRRHWWKHSSADRFEKIEHEPCMLSGRKLDRLSLRPPGTNLRDAGSQEADLSDLRGRRGSPATHEGRNGSEYICLVSGFKEGGILRGRSGIESDERTQGKIRRLRGSAR